MRRKHCRENISPKIHENAYAPAPFHNFIFSMFAGAGIFSLTDIFSILLAKPRAAPDKNGKAPISQTKHKIKAARKTNAKSRTVCPPAETKI
jgi:hypothetical protein